MKRQTFEPREDQELLIETPAGFIHLRWGRRKKKLLIDLPDRMSVQRGMERALASARFVEKRNDGVLVPKYRMLIAVVDERGALLGVEAPTVLRIAEG